jgi:hypothetical protein
MFILIGWAGVWLHGKLRARGVAAVDEPSPTVVKSETAAEAPSSAGRTDFRSARSPQLLVAMQVLIVICLAWQVVDTAFARGNYLAYFNFIAGGPSNGYRHLVDSSLDWGQELWGLKRWLDDHASELPPNVYVSYFGSSSPSYYGLEARWLPSFMPTETLEQDRKQPKEASLQEGIYCISATSLQCIYNGNFSGPWREDYEYNYRALHNLIIGFVQNKDNQAERDAQLKATGLPDWNTAVQLFEHARFGRLCEYLRRREPDDMVNYAVLIYRLSAAELREAMMNPPAEHYPAPQTPYDNVPY